ncbi:hypothetical protein NHX12_029808 [Muraenolepis orangiensis]|uniref:BEN domain-containing protein n=1 Tax=Muraenolepis orangiensis TaxID=630683 RepID=A0A9Q0E900_9TELE|nr:hypothetical protein NHX12_029808 [Muraenolepis orangiensis]
MYCVSFVPQRVPVLSIPNTDRVARRSVKCVLLMPPKRETVAAPTNHHQPPVKMMKMGPETQDFVCDPLADKYRFAECPGYSPFANQEIEQLQAQLKYERRCRILAERELRELKEMNGLMLQMRHTANELRVTLDQVRQGNSDAVSPQGPAEEEIALVTDPEGEMRIPYHIAEEDSNFLYLSESLRVPRNLYERISEITDFRKYTSALLMMLFDRETLATHSLHGRRANVAGDDSQKPQLPPEILSSIIDHVGVKFGVDGSQIKTAIRTKLNNEDKLLKKRMGINKQENKTAFDQSSSFEQSFEQNAEGQSTEND